MRLSKGIAIGILAFAGGAMVISLFKSKPWGDVPYLPKDGRSMFNFVDHQVIASMNCSLFGGIIHGPTSDETPCDRLAPSAGFPKGTDEVAAVGVIVFQGRLQPSMIQRANKVVSEHDTVRFTNTGFVVTPKFTTFFASHEFGQMVNVGGKETIDLKPIQKEWSQIEDNGKIQMNQDLAWIQVGKEMRIYAVDSVPARAKAIAKLIAKHKVTGLKNDQTELERTLHL